MPRGDLHRARAKRQKSVDRKRRYRGAPHFTANRLMLCLADDALPFITHPFSLSAHSQNRQQMRPNAQSPDNWGATDYWPQGSRLHAGGAGHGKAGSVYRDLVSLQSERGPQAGTAVHRGRFCQASFAASHPSGPAPGLQTRYRNLPARPGCGACHPLGKDRAGFLREGPRPRGRRQGTTRADRSQASGREKALRPEDGQAGQADGHLGDLRKKASEAPCAAFGRPPKKEGRKGAPATQKDQGRPGTGRPPRVDQTL